MQDFKLNSGEYTEFGGLTGSEESSFLPDEDFSYSDDADLYDDTGDALYGNAASRNVSYVDYTQNTLVSGLESIASPDSSGSGGNVRYSMQAIDNAGCGCSVCSDGQNALEFQEGTTSDFEGIAASGSGGSGGDYSGKPMATPAEFADYLVNGYWADRGTISHSWAQDNVTFSISNEFTAAHKQGIRMGFALWEDVADITFTEVGSGADITIVEGDDGRAYANTGFFGNGDITSGTISIDTNIFGWDDLDTIGKYGLQTVIHEIGHALGLGHSGNYNGSANYNDDAIWANDTRQYSVMSYFQASNSGADHVSSTTQYGATPLLYDILAIQTIYGANTLTRNGDTTYGFNSNAGRDQFDFSITDDPVVAIWDGGGTDTLDLSGYSLAQTINLNEGEFSNVGGLMTGNVVIAYGTVIENAVGGSGIDTIYGNDAGNLILGGAGDDIFYGSTGNDTLNGEAGDDTANYSYSVDDFAFDFIDSVTVSIEHLTESFTDLITNIENFIFSGVSYTFEALEDLFGDNSNDFAPEVTANSLSLQPGAYVLASSTVTATDADGDELTYEVWDSGNGNSTGYFDLNGTALSAGRGHSLTEAEFAALKITGGSSTGSETFWVRVSDGVHTTSWKSFTLSTATGGNGGNNTAPEVTTNALSVGTGVHVLASGTITATDADGDTLSYEVWDGGTKDTSGYLDLNGTVLSAGGGHVLTAAEFAALEIVGGSSAGDETFWVRVSDGAETTGWTAFTLTTTDSGVGGGGNTEPVVTANALSVESGVHVLVSSTITASDADGDTMTYEVWDSGNGNSTGYFDLNGAALSAGISHSLTEAEFAALEIVGGSSASSETLWVRVSDGTVTTSWKSFTLTSTAESDDGGGGNTAPEVTANALNVGTGVHVLASGTITASDEDGDTLTYEVWDGGTKGTSGYFDLNGTVLSAGGGHTLTAAEFAVLEIVGGSSTGDETFWVRVSDGAETTSWTTFAVTTTDGSEGSGNTAPAVTASALSVESGAHVLASGTIAASDADGDELTYEVWDSGTGSGTGYFDLNGTALSTGGGHSLTAAEFAALEIVGGAATGNETLWVRVSDGTETTSWKSFILTTTEASGQTLEMSDILETGSEEQEALNALTQDSQTIDSTGDMGISSAFLADQNDLPDTTHQADTLI